MVCGKFCDVSAVFSSGFLDNLLNLLDHIGKIDMNSSQEMVNMINGSIQMYIHNLPAMGMQYLFTNVAPNLSYNMNLDGGRSVNNPVAVNKTKMTQFLS